MNKKISGISNWESYEVRGKVQNSFREYSRSIERLKDKKEEHKWIKLKNEKVRQKMIKE